MKTTKQKYLMKYGIGDFFFLGNSLKINFSNKNLIK